jgi:tyrosine-protein phosphatase YwqE
MSKIEIKLGNSYIFKSNYVDTVAKGKVLEITKTTYLIEWEKGDVSRYLKDTFEYTTIEEFEKCQHDYYPLNQMYFKCRKCGKITE